MRNEKRTQLKAVEQRIFCWKFEQKIYPCVDT